MSIKKLGRAALVTWFDEVKYELLGSDDVFLLDIGLTAEAKEKLLSLQPPSKPSLFYPFFCSTEKEETFRRQLSEYESNLVKERERLTTIIKTEVSSRPIKSLMLGRRRPSNSMYYVYKENIYKLDRSDYSDEQVILQINDLEDEEQRKFEYLRNKLDTIQEEREPIPEKVQSLVWRRDKAKCVKCGSNKNLEFDHMIPFSKGGSNTVRNIQLLCERCNREKKDKI